MIVAKRTDVEPPSRSWILAFMAKEIAIRREALGLSQAELGVRTLSSRQKVTSYEVGTRVPQQDFIERADDVLGFHGTLFRLWEDLMSGRYPAWFVWYARMEARASRIWHYESDLIPGLLQTRDYAHSVFATVQPPLPQQELDGYVTARMGRQCIFERDDPPEAWFILDEAVFHRWPRRRESIRPQIERVLEVARLPSVTLQVIPFAFGHHSATDGLRTYLSFEGGDDVGYVEPFGGGMVISNPGNLALMRRTYDLLRAEALPPAASDDFLCDLMETV